MAASAGFQSRRRARRGSLERPVNGRMYRGTWLLVGLPLLVAAFSVTQPEPLPAPPLPATFDAASAQLLAEDLVAQSGERSPGDLGPVNWIDEKFRLYGFRSERQQFEAEVPGLGKQTLTNVLVRVPGRSPRVIVVLAHRDGIGFGGGLVDNASGTAALVELARAYAAPATAGAPTGRVRPAHTLLFVSTDGGAYGSIGAAHLAQDPAYRDRIAAVVALDSLGGNARPRLAIDSDRPITASPVLVRTAAERVLEETGEAPIREGVIPQLRSLAFPYSLFEQAPFVSRGVAAVTLTTAAEHRDPRLDESETLDGERLGQLGSAAQQLLLSLDQGLEPGPSTTGYLYLGDRILHGWAIQLVLAAMTLPFLAAAVDLFARTRRRRIPLAPALRALRTRLLFWLSVGAFFALLGLVGAWPDGSGRPLPPTVETGRTWPVLALTVLGLASVVAWGLARYRLVPKRPATDAEELAGHTAALLGLGLLTLLVVVTNAYGLIFLLPALHAWLWLPQLRDRGPLVRSLVLAAGFAGPLLLVLSFATSLDLGFDAPWYLVALVTVGYVPAMPALLLLVMAACAAQLTALAAGRYAPYPDVAERGPRGPFRELVRRIALAARARRRGEGDDVRAVGG
jgi:hypothetical protein